MDHIRTRRLATLDLLRGIAAVAVLCVHFPFAPEGIALAPKGYLAVDFFFILSGFVIAQAYEERLRSSPWFRLFCLARLIRLWPLYAFASVIGIGAALLAAPQQGAGKWVSSLVLSAAFLPTPAQLSVEPDSFYPFNFAAWSLFWELVVNIVYAALAPRLSARLLAIIVGLGFAVLASICIAGHSIDAGANWRGVAFGAVRSTYGFFTGVALYRVQQRRPALSVSWLIPTSLLIVALFLGWANPLYDLACVTLVFPLLIWIGAQASYGSAVLAPSLFLGYLSYPIYVLHSPLIDLLTRLRGHSGPLPRFPVFEVLLVYVVAMLLIGWLVARLFDTPTRAWLNRRFTPRKPQAAAQTAP